jgi:hypothetical protein
VHPVSTDHDRHLLSSRMMLSRLAHHPDQIRGTSAEVFICTTLKLHNGDLRISHHLRCLNSKHDQKQLMRGLHAHAGTESRGLETTHERHQDESLCRLSSPPLIEKRKPLRSDISFRYGARHRPSFSVSRSQRLVVFWGEGGDDCQSVSPGSSYS